MNCEQRIEAIFRGEMVDRVPFALKGWRVPFCSAERRLRNEGMGTIEACPVFTTTSPNVKVETIHYVENAMACQRTIIKTPVGELTSVSQEVGTEKIERTTWLTEPPFKDPDDYKVLMFMVKDQRYAPAYEAFNKARAQLGGDAFLKTTTPGVPLHDITYRFMGLETFSIEWLERQDEVLALHEAMVENQREMYRIVAQSPALVVTCGGNYSSEVLGKQMLIEYVLPHWEEVGALFHEYGKLIGCHLDANNKLWAPEIGASALDWIEAYTPAPDTDLTLAEARAAWAGKTLFINFPSSVHIQPPDVVARTTRQLLKEAAPGDRFIMGITENVPENCWRESFAAILNTCNEYGRLPIDPTRL